jgi:hypothetical protein
MICALRRNTTICELDFEQEYNDNPEISDEDGIIMETNKQKLNELIQRNRSQFIF